MNARVEAAAKVLPHDTDCNFNPDDPACTCLHLRKATASAMLRESDTVFLSDALLRRVVKVLSRRAPQIELSDVPHEAHARAVVAALREEA
jgi:hypothetical protein